MVVVKVAPPSVEWCIAGENGVDAKFEAAYSTMPDEGATRTLVNRRADCDARPASGVQVAP